MVKELSRRFVLSGLPCSFLDWLRLVLVQFMSERNAKNVNTVVVNGNRTLMSPYGWYLTVILRRRAGYELIYITNEAVGRVGYYQLISGKSEKNNCFSKFSGNSLDFFGWNLLKSWHFLYRRQREKIFSDLKISAQEIRHQFFLIWSNLTIMAHIMGWGSQSKSWKIIILS